MYRDNTKRCERVFAGICCRISVQEYMPAGKARDAFRLLQKGAQMTLTAYISEAVACINTFLRDSLALLLMHT